MVLSASCPPPKRELGLHNTTMCVEMHLQFQRQEEMFVMSVTLQQSAQLAGAYDIKNHILNGGKQATARGLKNRSMALMGERESMKRKGERGREADRLQP